MGGIYAENSGLTITDSEFSKNIGGWGATEMGRGGGICILGCTVDITGCKFLENYTGEAGPRILELQALTSETRILDGGGGVFANDCNLTIEDSFFVGNASDKFGGGLSMQAGQYSISNCTFTNNRSFAYQGGAIFGYGTITNCTFLSNDAGDGGGAISGGGIINNCIFVRNRTFNDSYDFGGGGAYITANPTSIKSCFFFGNGVNRGYGGGLSISGCSPIIADCLFTGNGVNRGYGGGISIINATPTISNCSILNNIVQGDKHYKAYGGGIYLGGVSVATINNCILRENSATGAGPEIYNDGSSLSASYCNIDQDGFEGSNGNIRIDPLFVNNPDPGLDDTWGTEDDNYGNLHLQIASPCIDSGTSDNASVTDMEGLYRSDVAIVPNTGGGVYPYYDMGAYEFEGVVLIDLTSFTATPRHKKVIIKWSTESETDNAGFNVYRSTSEEGDYEQINDTLISAEGSITEGAEYEFIDEDVENRKTYYYKLEDIDMLGISNMQEPVSATPRLI